MPADSSAVRATRRGWTRSSSIANRFKAKGTPYTIVIDKRGEIAARIAGRAGEARLARVLDPLVKEPAKRKPPARLQ